MSNFEDALGYFSSRIWSKGEIKNFDGCFCLSSFVSEKHTVEEFMRYSDYIWAVHPGVTHYGLKWSKKGKEVILSLGSGDAFGACRNENIKLMKEYTISVEE